jgi:hypothetical protein
VSDEQNHSSQTRSKLVFANFVGLLCLGLAVVVAVKGQERSDVADILFALFFGFGGLAVMATAVSEYFKNQRSARSQSSSAIQSNTGSHLGYLILMGAALVVVGLGVAVWAEPTAGRFGGDKLARLLWLFPLLGAVLLAAAGYTFLRRRKFGIATFQATTPATIGGALSGVVRVSAVLQTDAGVRLQLVCLRRYLAGSGKQSHPAEDVLWEGEKWLGENLARTNTGCDVPVHFTIPNDAQPTRDGNPNDGVVWRLTVTSAQPGVDFRASFDVPVGCAVIGAISKTTTATPDPLARYEISATRLVALEDPGVTVMDLPGGGKEFYFPAARHIGNAVGVTIFWLVWTAAWLAAEFFIFTMADFLAVAKWILIVLTSGIGGVVSLIFFVATANCWLKKVRVTVTRDGVTIVRRWLVFWRTRTVAARDLGDFSAAVEMENNATKYRTIRLTTRGDQEVRVITMIRHEREADWLIEQMRAARR